MCRATSFLLPVLLLTLGSIALAQDSQIAKLQEPENAMTEYQLVMWSNMQKPQPAPQPLPPQDKAVPQPGQQPDQQPQSPADPHQADQAPTAQSFTGKIVKDNGQFVLKVSPDVSYRLDGQNDVKQYENQEVKVVGRLDAASNTIYVTKIELIS